MRIVYVNGEFLPENEAKISIFDRGFLMADGVYEVTSVVKGRLLDFPAHMTRLARSLSELNMKSPTTDDVLLYIHHTLIEKNNLTEGLVYLQVTRGAEDRDFAYSEDLEPSLVLFTQEKNLTSTAALKNGISVISVEDIRWARRDIKTIQLLAPSLAKMEAKAAGKDDAWLVHDGLVNEGTSNNTYIVTKDGTIVTRQLSDDILHGITRAAILQVADELQFKVEERPFSIAEAQNAREAFITAATTFAVPVVEIDGQQIGDGKPGTVASRLREIYLKEVVEDGL